MAFVLLQGITILVMASVVTVIDPKLSGLLRPEAEARELKGVRLAPKIDFALNCCSNDVVCLSDSNLPVLANGAPCLHVCVACLGIVSAGSRPLDRVVVACRSYSLMLVHGGLAPVPCPTEVSVVSAVVCRLSLAVSPVSCCPPKPLSPCPLSPDVLLNPCHCPLSHPNT